MKAVFFSRMMDFVLMKLHGWFGSWFSYRQAARARSAVNSEICFSFASEQIFIRTDIAGNHIKTR